MTNHSLLFQAVGDIAFGDHPLCSGFGTHSTLRDKPALYAFEEVLPILQKADLLFGNLECTLSESGLRPRDYRSMQMRGHPVYLQALKAAGFAVLNVANNHSLQHGRTAFCETLTYLRGAGIQPCGVAGEHYRSAKPEVIHRNGLSVGFVGYSLRPRQYFTEAPLYAEGTAETIVSDVANLRSRVDVVVVSLHWGDEFIDRPSPREIALAHQIIDAGTDLVIGHHPHVLRGVERYGRGYVVYSLGNFVCDMLWDDTLRETAVLQCQMTSGGVRDVRMVPVRISDDCRPVRLEGSAATALNLRINGLSSLLRDASSTDADYTSDAARAHRDARRKSHQYFVTNLRRFPPALLSQQVLTFIRNRFAERGLLKPADLRG